MADWKKVLTEQDIDATATLGTSDAKVPSQKAVKAYVDTQVATADTLEDLSDTNIGTLASGHIIVYDGTDTFDNVAVGGDAGLASNGTLTINDDAVTYAKMQDIATANRVLGATSAGTVAEVQVQTDMIASDAITGALIADDQIDSNHYVDGSIDTAHIANDAVDGNKLADNIDIAGTLDVTGNATFDGAVRVVGNLTIEGSSTTVNTTDLVVQDKTIRLGAPTTAYSTDSDASAGADGGGIFLESTKDDDNETAYARIVWKDDAKLSGWTVANTGTSTADSDAFEIATMSFSGDSQAPTADLNNIGGFHFDTGNETLYIRVS